MKVLIIAKYFAPQPKIGAVRPTKIAKYLKKNYGCEITVATWECENQVIDTLGESDLQYVDHMIQCPQTTGWWLDKLLFLEGKSRHFISNNKVDGTLGHVLGNENKTYKERIIVQFSMAINLLKELRYAKEITKKILEREDSYDVVFSTCGPISSIVAGARYKKKFPGVIWNADYRDAIHAKCERNSFCQKLESFLVNRANKIANIITVVSDGITEDMKWKSDIRVVTVTNGYDMDDSSNIKGEEISSKFTFSYTGQLYQNKRDITVLFAVLKELVDDNIIEEDKVCFIYAGHHFNGIRVVASRYKMERILIDEGFVDRKQAVLIQKKSNILIVASWNQCNSYSGVLSGKFLEYMGIKLPIVAIVIGDKKYSLLKQMIHKGNLGFCYEEVEGLSEKEKLKKYILEQYNFFVKNGRSLYEGDEQYVEQFSYPALVDRLYQLWTGCMK